MSEWKDVARALLGTWPSQIAAWGQEGVAAYVGELEARALTPDGALEAIRAYDPDADFPPSAAKLASNAKADPSMPTFAEALRDLRRALNARQDYFAGASAKERVCVEWLEQHSHELVARFFEAQSYERLSQLPIDDPAYGQLEVKRLHEDWDAFTERADERRAAGLPLGSGTRRKQLGPHKPDFAGALPAGPTDHDPGEGVA